MGVVDSDGHPHNHDDTNHDNFITSIADQVREGKLAGAPVRIVRTGNIGEVSFEISVPANYGRALWELGPKPRG